MSYEQRLRMVAALCKGSVTSDSLRKQFPRDEDLQALEQALLDRMRGRASRIDNPSHQAQLAAL